MFKEELNETKRILYEYGMEIQDLKQVIIQKQIFIWVNRETDIFSDAHILNSYYINF